MRLARLRLLRFLVDANRPPSISRALPNPFPPWRQCFVRSLPPKRSEGMSDIGMVCLITDMGEAGFVVRVQRGGELFVAETHLNLESASARAEEIGAALLRHGWRDVDQSERLLSRVCQLTKLTNSAVRADTRRNDGAVDWWFFRTKSTNSTRSDTRAQLPCRIPPSAPKLMNA